MLDLVDYKVFGMDVHAACLASRNVARSSSYRDSLLFGHQGLFIPDNNYLLFQTVASYSSIHSMNSPPALAQPAMPSNRITLSISLSPCSSRWSLNHPAAREPRPREDAGRSQYACPSLYAASFGGRNSRPTAVPDDLLDSRRFKQAVQRRYGRVEALCRQIDGSANGAALDDRMGELMLD